MPSGVYQRTPGAWSGNGGKRRNTPAPKLGPAEVQTIRALRGSGQRIKTLARQYDVNPSLINRVLGHQGAYKDMK